MSYTTNTFYNYAENVMYDEKSVQPGLWDTAKEFDRIRLLFYPESDMILIFSSIIDHSSYRNVTDK